MVTTDIDQFTEECNAWREALRSQREEFSRMKNDLQNAATHITSKDALKAVEHYENQFDIQLFNIHDLKQAVKTHAKQYSMQLAGDDEAVPALSAEHGQLAKDFKRLQHTLLELKADFKGFLVHYT